jgi:hypothetical protein
MAADRIVAWRVTACGFPDAGIYAAATQTGAKVLALAAAEDAGYTIAWTDLDVRRTPEFDSWVVMQGRGRGWDEAYARRCMAGDETKDRLGTRLPGSETDAP